MIPAALKRSLKRRLSSPLLWPAVARLLPPFTVVLAYHRVNSPELPFNKVTVENFRAQMAWIRRHCTVLHPQELRASVRRRFSRVPVLITFDDGYRDYLEHAYPSLREFDIPAINFIATRYVDDGAMFWWELVNLGCQQSTRPQVTLPWSGERFVLDRASERTRLYRACKRHLKASPDEQRHPLLAAVFEALDVDETRLALVRQVMTWDEIRSTRDVTTYGGHLHSHPRVSRINAAQLDEELTIAGRRMREELGKASAFFAYPDGDVTEDAKAAVRRHGYELAFGITPGVVTPATDWMAVERIPGPESVGELAWRIARYVRMEHRTAGPAALSATAPRVGDA